jgi:serine/threonine protein kinase
MSQFLLKYDLVHGDIKPPNVMIAKDENENLEFKIIDYGSITEIFSKNTSLYNSNIPDWLDSVILRSIAIDKERRYGHYSEMNYELKHQKKVKPFFPKNATLIERSPLTFFKSGFIIMLILNMAILIWMNA